MQLHVDHNGEVLVLFAADLCRDNNSLCCNKTFLLQLVFLLLTLSNKHSFCRKMPFFLKKNFFLYSKKTEKNTSLFNDEQQIGRIVNGDVHEIYFEQESKV